MTTNIAAKEVLTHFHVQLDRADDDIAGQTDIESIDADNSLDGQIASYTPPTIETRDLEWPTHADGEELVDGGLENMQSILASGKYSGDFYAVHGRIIKLTCYNALRTGTTAKLLKHEITGPVQIVESGEITPGTRPDITLTLNVEKFRVYYGGSGEANLKVDTDVNARKRVIGGVDQLGPIREALGLT